MDGGIKKWIKAGNNVYALESIKSANFVDVLKMNKVDILDVRRESEYFIKHIEGAINLPLGQIQQNMMKLNIKINYIFIVLQVIDRLLQFQS